MFLLIHVKWTNSHRILLLLCHFVLVRSLLLPSTKRSVTISYNSVCVSFNLIEFLAVVVLVALRCGLSFVTEKRISRVSGIMLVDDAIVR